MAEPNDFTPKTVGLTPAQVRILGLASLAKHAGGSVNPQSYWERIPEEQQQREAYLYLKELMSTQNGTFELRRLLGESATPLISAWAQEAVSQMKPVPGAIPPTNIPTGTTTKDWEFKVKQYAEQMGVPFNIAMGVLDIESGGKAEARGTPNPANASGFIQEGDRAQGLMQVMPGHYRAAGIPQDRWLDPDLNIQMGLNILKQNYDRTKDWDQAIKDYFGSGVDVNGVNTSEYLSRWKSSPYSTAGTPANVAAVAGGEPTRFKADIIGQKDYWTRYEEATNQLAIMPWEKKYQLDENGQPVPDAQGGYQLSPEAVALQELADQAYNMARYGPKAGSQGDIDAWVEGFKKYTGRNPTEQELLQKFGVGAGGAGRDEVGLGNLEMRRQEFEYGKGQDVLARQDALQKERNAIMKAKAEAEQWLAELEGRAQDRYSEAASWGVFPKGQPVPTAPSFPGLPGLDLNNYRVAAPDFYGPAKTARERIAAEFAGMKAGE